jgi:hypothetical protein
MDIFLSHNNDLFFWGTYGVVAPWGSAVKKYFFLLLVAIGTIKIRKPKYRIIKPQYIWGATKADISQANV